jgi:hypothetical protein
MKRKNAVILVAGLLACTLPLASAGIAAQEKQKPELLPSTPTTIHQQDGQQAQQPEVKTFTGTISKSGEKFVLEESSMKTALQLDDQEKAQKYQGKNVRVTGTLDAENNLIHVQSIEEAV